MITAQQKLKCYVSCNNRQLATGLGIQINSEDHKRENRDKVILKGNAYISIFHVFVNQ